MMGGFLESGARNVWSFLAPIGILIISKRQYSLLTLAGFTTAFLYVISFPSKPSNFLPTDIATSLTGLNLALMFTFSFTIYYFLIRQIEMQNELEKEIIVAENIAKAKSNFMSIMSHEIRTPLNSIIGISEYLKEEMHDSELYEDVEILDFSSKALLELVNDILDYSKMEASKFNLEIQNFNLDQLLSGVLASFHQQAIQKKVLLTHYFGFSDQLILDSDPVRLGQILNNLLSNAIKFSPESEVNLMVSYQDSNLVVIVKDTGIGMTPKQLEFIFNRFAQADDSITRKFGGTGLGLAITKSLVQLFKGTIEVESIPDQGSTFKISIPIAQPKTMNSKEESTFDLSGFSILLVDDNLLNLKVSAKILERLKAKVSTVSSGEEAIQILEKKHFNLILMDLQMPELDGYQTSKVILKRFPMLKAPIVAFSAENKHEVLAKLKDCGIQGFIPKPFSRKNFEEVISELFKDDYSNLNLGTEDNTQ